MGFRDGTPVYRCLQVIFLLLTILIIKNQKTSSLSSLPKSRIFELLIIITLPTLAILFSPNTPSGVESFIPITLLGLYFSSQRGKKGLFIFSLSCTISIIITFFYHLIQVKGFSFDRLFLLGQNPNITSVYLSCLIIIFSIITEKIKRNGILFLCFICLFSLSFLLFLTVSRASILSLSIIVLGVISHYFLRKRFALAFCILFALLLGFSSASLNLSTYEKNRIKNIANINESITNENENSKSNPLESRFIIYYITLENFSTANNKEKINGLPLDSFSEKYNQFVLKNETKIRENFHQYFEHIMCHPHNVYLYMLWGYGFFGLLTFLLLNLYILYHSIKNKNMIALSLTCFLLIQGLVDVSINFFFGKFLWILPLGLVLYDHILAKRKNIEENI